MTKESVGVALGLRVAPIHGDRDSTPTAEMPDHDRAGFEEALVKTDDSPLVMGPDGVAVPRRGLKLGKYELIRPLGTGGMAQVWLAHKPILGGSKKVCAIKMPTDLLGSDERLRDGLLNEIRIASMLSHSNIVQVFDAGIVHGILYMELERIDGMDLSVLLQSMRDRQTPMSIEMAVYIMRAVLEGLNYAHTFAIDGRGQGIVHRDLSPSNVLISSAGEVKIMDFGIGKTEHDLTSGQHVKGKLRYMAPEQALGTTTAKVDLFAIGAMFFEMLEGRRFRERGAAMEMMAAAINQPAPKIEREDVPAVLRSFYEQLVEIDPAKRTANAAEALRNLSLWRGTDIHAHDMRGFYLRQLDRGRHSGFTMGSIAVPESFRRLVEALEASTDSAEGAGEREDPELMLAQQVAAAEVRAAARVAPPAVAAPVAGAPERETDAPVQPRRSSGVGATRVPAADVHAPADRPAPTQDALPLPPRATPQGFDVDVPTLVHPGGRPGGALPDRTQPLTPRPSPATLPEVGDAADDTDARPVPQARETRSSVWPIVLVAASLLVIATMTTFWWLARERPVAESKAASATTLATPAMAVPKAGEIALAEPPKGPNLEVTAPPPAEERPAAPMPAPTVVDSPVSEAASSTEAGRSAVAPAAAADPKRKPKAKPVLVDLRLTPMLGNGEVRLGKRTWRVDQTMDVTIAVGRHKAAIRPLEGGPWTALPDLVVEAGFSYIVRVNSESVTVSRSETPKRPP